VTVAFPFSQNKFGELLLSQAELRRIAERDILPRVAAENRSSLQYSLDASLTHNPTAAKFKHNWKTIIERVLPKIPRNHLPHFLKSGLPATLAYNPSRKMWQTIVGKVLPKIPAEHRASVFRYALPTALQHKPTPAQLEQVWKTVAEKVLPTIPTQHHSDFFQHTLPEALSHNPKPAELSAIWQTISEKVLPAIPQQDREDFFEQGLIAVLRKNPSVKAWRTIAEDILPSIKPEHRANFFRYALPGTLRGKPTPSRVKKVWQTIVSEVLPAIPENHQPGFLSDGLPNSDRFDQKSLRQQATAAKLIFDRMDNSGFASSVVNQNFGKLADPEMAVSRLNFRKTGGVLTPLGGKMTGHILRIIDKRSYSAWKKAHDLGLPVEPILQVREAKDGRMQVVTKFVGETEYKFIQAHPEHAQEVTAQKLEIMSRFKSEDIEHGDYHNLNFVVRMEKGLPKVRIIDFDEPRA